jgi:hypothetical protein
MIEDEMTDEERQKLCEQLRDMFRQKAHDCDIEFKETYDPAAASAAYAYTEAAGEVERLRARIKE